jgi:uncharacterized protein (DUF2132 family)
MPSPSIHPHDPLHGITLESIINQLVARHGWPEMGQRIRVAADLPEAERSDLEIMRTNTPAFQELIESLRNRREDWFQVQAGHVEIGSVPIPTRSMSAGRSKKSP